MLVYRNTTAKANRDCDISYNHKCTSKHRGCKIKNDLWPKWNITAVLLSKILWTGLVKGQSKLFKTTKNNRSTNQAELR